MGPLKAKSCKHAGSSELSFQGPSQDILNLEWSRGPGISKMRRSRSSVSQSPSCRSLHGACGSGPLLTSDAQRKARDSSAIRLPRQRSIFQRTQGSFQLWAFKTRLSANASPFQTRSHVGLGKAETWRGCGPSLLSLLFNVTTLRNHEHCLKGSRRSNTWRTARTRNRIGPALKPERAGARFMSSGRGSLGKAFGIRITAV